jgi:hypothetical protein
MIPQTQKPPMQGNIDGFRKHSIQHNFTRKPPYAKSLNLRGQNLVICTGSGAWELAKSQTWFHRCKVVLPFGDDPSAYTWSIAAGHDVIVAGFGELESISTIAKMGGLLLTAGAGLVLYAPEQGPMMRINARSGVA